MVNLKFGRFTQFAIGDAKGWLYIYGMDGWMNQAYSRLSTTHGHITDCKSVCMYWTRLVLVRPAASLYSASPLKHHPTGKQWCPNLAHYSDSEPARWFLTLFALIAKQISRTSNFNVCCLTRPGIEPPTSRIPGERSTTTLPRCGTLHTFPTRNGRRNVIWISRLF